MAVSKELTVIRGKTLQLALRWETTPFVYKAITAIANTAPASVTATSHGLTSGWRVAVVSVKGMTEINAEDPAKLRSKDFHEVTYVDADTVTLNDVNAAEFSTYASGGYLQFYTPRDLTNWTCRVKFKDKVGGTVLLSTEAADSPNNLITATVDNTAKVISILVPATATAALTKSSGVWEAEMYNSSTQVVESLVAVSKFTVTTEVVT